MRTLFRDKLGRFCPPERRKIVPGRLYGYRGSVVRAGRLCHNQKRHVSFHKQLHGFVNDSDLVFIDRTQVQNYLEKA